MKARFGMLMTDAYGKAGGQAIQRRGSIRVLRNITIPTERLASRQNPQRVINSKLFNGWSFLSKAERDQWSEVGSFLSAVNGWGEEKTLSGRQAYTKLNSIVYAKTNVLLDPALIGYEVPFFNAISASINVANGEVAFDISDVTDVSFFQMKAMRLRSDAVSPLIEKLKTFYRPALFSDDSNNYNFLKQSVGDIAVGNVFSIAIRGVSSSGITSPWFQFTVTAV